MKQKSHTLRCGLSAVVTLLPLAVDHLVVAAKDEIIYIGDRGAVQMHHAHHSFPVRLDSVYAKSQ